MVNLKSIKKQELNVLIVDDHRMLREGLKLMLAGLKKQMLFNVLEAESGEEAIRLLGHKKVELIIMDYQLPGFSGLETIQRILRFKPAMKILTLSNYDEIAYVESMMNAGAKGYILKNIEPVELLKAISQIQAGEVYYCSEVAVKLIESQKEDKNKNVKGGKLLSRRETEVLNMIAMAMTNEEIAEKLFVSKRTID
ncbi:MAG: response regulator transcription factor, partial [Ferruginibacter sp.]